MYSLKNRSFQKAFKNSWWVVILCVFGFSCFWTVHLHQKRELRKLNKVISKLEIQQKEELKKNEEFVLKIKSLSDPAFIEMILMQNLGLVPKDQVKVVY